MPNAGYIDHGIATPRSHMSNKYANLTYMIGARLKILRLEGLYAIPEEVTFIADYPKTIMIEMKFVKDLWNPINPKPRYARQMIPKASLAVGDVKLANLETGEQIFGRTVAPIVLSDAEARI